MPINLIFTIAHNFSLFLKIIQNVAFIFYCGCCSIFLYLKFVSETQMFNDF